MYYNTADDTVYVYDGATWLDLAAGGGSSSGVGLESVFMLMGG